MRQILPIACGLDVHKDTIEACILIVNGTDEPDVIRETFSTMRGDIIRLRDWLISLNCLNVAMESTGVYWKPVYEILEEVKGINQCLVNSQHMRNVPGRKNDEDDAEWIASLYLCGLLDKSFVPEKEVRDLREYTRVYRKLVQSRVTQSNRIEKFLQTHGFKLSSVLSSITGVSGMRILEILCEQGEITITDVENSLERGVKKTAEEIAFAINGKLSKASQTLLKLMLCCFNSINEQIETVYNAMRLVSKPFMPIILLLATIPGIDILSATYIVGEIGVNMSQFRRGASSLVKWAGLSPRNDQSAGKIKSRKTLKGNPYVKSILCQCAWAAVKTRNTRVSNWYWRNVKRLGEKKAIIAVARKLLVYVYCIINTTQQYNKQLDIADTEKIKAFKLDEAKRLILKSEGSTSGLIPIEGNIQGTNIEENQLIQTIGKTNKRQKSPNTSPLNISGSNESDPHIISEELMSSPSDASVTESQKPKKRGRPKKNPVTS